MYLVFEENAIFLGLVRDSTTSLTLLEREFHFFIEEEIESVKYTSSSIQLTAISVMVMSENILTTLDKLVGRGRVARGSSHKELFPFETVTT